jgi:MoaA/NifB/PqqE/SkfB family radical SAM enzyme
MSPVLERMPILVLNPHSRCNCRCVMCDIWKTAEVREISAEDLERHVESMERLGVEWVVFSGGEPLMHSDLFRLCTILRERRIRITILSSGLLLERHARAVAGHVDDVIVSLDGPPEIHDSIRGVPGAYKMLAAGIRAIRSFDEGFRITARCTIQKRNFSHLMNAVAAARAIGLNGISFLAADLTSQAFNRPQGWMVERQDGVGLTQEELERLEREIEAVAATGECGRYVAESAHKLHAIAEHFRAHLGLAAPVAPACNAPWVSAVLEADGIVKPCFFHAPIGRVDEQTSLLDVVNGAQAIAFRAALDVSKNAVCRRCVCSLNRTAGPTEAK